ncbi:hypothetical protein [Streptomyces sp. TRM75563]|nr:hypothetical protein [Streptomyces sp. TRM75563]
MGGQRHSGEPFGLGPEPGVGGRVEGPAGDAGGGGGTDEFW